MGWLTIGSSVTGLSHEATGAECQDRNQRVVISSAQNEEVVICVVADGAGSSNFGGEGAEIACSVFIEELRTHFGEGSGLAELNTDFGRDFIESCQERLRIIAEDRGDEIREFASTLVGCVIGNSEAVFYQVGDGGVVYSVEPDTDNYLMAIPTLPGIYANVTHFITDSNAANSLRYSRVPLSVARVALFTDGLQNLAVDYTSDDHGIPFARFFAPMFDPLVSSDTSEILEDRLRQFLTSEAVNNRTDDDKTLLLIKRDQ